MEYTLMSVIPKVAFHDGIHEQNFIEREPDGGSGRRRHRCCCRSISLFGPSLYNLSIDPNPFLHALPIHHIFVLFWLALRITGYMLCLSSPLPRILQPVKSILILVACFNPSFSLNLASSHHLQCHW
jgi:hypothetical protein